MARLAVFFGVVFAAIGLFMGFGHSSGFDAGSIGVVAIGLLLVLSGLLTTARPAARMHAMHVAALAGVIGIGWGVWVWIRSTNGPGPYWPGIATAVLSVVFVVLCVRSFINARRARESQAAP